MESSFTELEMGAVLQLIQLSGGCAGGYPVLWLNFAAKKEEEEEEKSTGETSTVVDSENSSADDDVLPRGNRRYRSLVDIYRKTQPSIKYRAKKKRPRF